MKFFLSTVALTAFVLPTLAAAFPGLNKAKSEIRHHQQKSLKFSGNCTNFSGTWKGKCTDTNGAETEESMVIEQNSCDSVTINDAQSYNFGGANTDTQTGTWSTNVFTTNLDWNADKTVAKLVLGGGGRILGQRMNWTMNGSGWLHLSADKLYSRFGFQWQSTNANGETSVGGNGANCAYEKQP
jgi:hypothetical protein